jgi:hypothetical protein
MATLCRAYTTDDEARAAVDRLLSAGVAGAEVRVISGAVAGDARDAAAGSFAGATAGPEPVGSFAGAAHSAHDGMGSFAGDADAQRRGGFGDIDRETVTTHRDGVTQVRIASHHALERMLRDAGLDEPTAAADIEAVHRGRVLVLVSSVMDGGALATAIDA